jgi:RNA polymerase sigma-70 factor (ECF subfamily)
MFKTRGNLQPFARQRPSQVMDPNWNTIVEELGPRLFRYFRARFSLEESSDLTQETLIRLVQKIKGGSFDPDRGTLRMFAYGIAHFVALESAKLARRIEPQVELHHAATLEQQYIERQTHEHMRQALCRLEPVQVQIVSLMIDEELSLADIATLLGMPVGTVKSHVHRSKEALREILRAKESL